MCNIFLKSYDYEIVTNMNNGMLLILLLFLERNKHFFLFLYVRMHLYANAME